jgi:type I restriction enzyme R subunit
LASEVKSFRIFGQDTVDQFAEVFFDPENTGTEGAHAKLSSLVQPARDKFIASDVETQEEFRSTLGSFLRLYKFQSQIVSYADTHLEKLYTFGRFLYKELPKGTGQPDVEFEDELALQYYRLEKSEEGGIDIETTDGEVQDPTETGRVKEVTMTRSSFRPSLRRSTTSSAPISPKQISCSSNS